MLTQEDESSSDVSDKELLVINWDNDGPVHVRGQVQFKNNGRLQLRGKRSLSSQYLLTFDDEDNVNDQPILLDGKNTIGSQEDFGETDSNSKRQFNVKKCRDQMITHRGILYALLSTVLLSFASMVVTLLDGEVSSNEIAFIRSFQFVLFLLPSIAFQNVSFRLTRKACILLAYRGIAGSINLCLVYFTYQAMPVGNSKAIFYSSIVFTGLLGWMCLKEPCTFLDAVFCLITLVGAVIVARPTFIFSDTSDDDETTNPAGPIVAFITAFLAATNSVAIRKLGSSKVHPLLIVASFSVCGVIVGASVTTGLGQWTNPSCGMSRLLLILNAFFGFTAQVLVAIALKLENATYVTIIRSSDVVFSFILSYILFGTVPDYWTVIGTCLILSALVGVSLKKIWATKKEKDNQFEQEESET